MSLQNLIRTLYCGLVLLTIGVLGIFAGSIAMFFYSQDKKKTMQAAAVSFGSGMSIIVIGLAIAALAEFYANNHAEAKQRTLGESPTQEVTPVSASLISYIEILPLAVVVSLIMYFGSILYVTFSPYLSSSDKMTVWSFTTSLWLVSIAFAFYPWSFAVVNAIYEVAGEPADIVQKKKLRKRLYNELDAARVHVRKTSRKIEKLNSQLNAEREKITQLERRIRSLDEEGLENIPLQNMAFHPAEPVVVPNDSDGD